MTVAGAEPYLIRQGDVFITRGNGSKELVGRAGVVEDDPGLTIFPDLFIRVQLHETPLLPRFFEMAWNSLIVRDRINEYAKTTSGIWKVNQGHIASIAVPIPPVDEQRHVIAQREVLLEKVETAKQLQANVTVELDALLPSILNEAFKGEL
jgi:type I restriction enzyme S subunit